MLIQVQKLKLDIETWVLWHWTPMWIFFSFPLVSQGDILIRAMLELNQILRANEINFAVLAALPAFFLSLLLLMVVRAWFKQVNALFLFIRIQIKPKAYIIAVWMSYVALNEGYMHFDISEIKYWYWFVCSGTLKHNVILGWQDYWGRTGEVVNLRQLLSLYFRMKLQITENTWFPLACWNTLSFSHLSPLIFEDGLLFEWLITEYMLRDS